MCNPSNIRMKKSMRMTWVGNTAYVGVSRNEYTMLSGKPKGTWPLGRLQFCTGA